MTGASPHSFIFDVEGTLVDSVPQILDCWRTVLKEAGHDVSIPTLQSYSGMDPNDMLSELLPESAEKQRSEIIEKQGQVYRRSYLQTVKGLAGVRELLGELKRRGHAIALATTCDAKELGHYRGLMGVDELIDAIACGDDVKHGKPHPDLFELALKRLGETTATVVGDTPFDAIAGKKLGLKSIGLLTGGFSEAKLLEAGCAAVYATPGDLLSAFSKTEIA
jgi:HAD superfamily hydrolase (TIGR01509 family)